MRATRAVATILRPYESPHPRTQRFPLDVPTRRLGGGGPKLRLLYKTCWKKSGIGPFQRRGDSQPPEPARPLPDSFVEGRYQLSAREVEVGTQRAT